jgi:hypothetical protein
MYQRPSAPGAGHDFCLVLGASTIRACSSSLKARLRANAMDGKVWADKSRLQSALVRVCKPIRKIGQFKLS